MLCVVHKMIDILFEMNRLKSITRKGWKDSGIISPESVADHTFRTALMAMMLSPDGLDRDRMIRMALIHEAGEVDIGDLTPYDISPEEKLSMERKTVDRLAQVSGDWGEEMKTLWEEYEEQKTREARFVRQLDMLEMGMQALEYENLQSERIKKERWTFWEFVEKRLSDPGLVKIFEDMKGMRKWNR